MPMFLLTPLEDFRRKTNKDKESRAPHIFSSSCSLLSYLLPLTVLSCLFISFHFISFLTTTTMDNTPNNNNQLIHSKPKIPYTRHLVEDDKNHEVSIFRLHHFQSRIAFTLLYYLMFFSFGWCTWVEATVCAL
jgi:hypothetical protein